MPLPLPTTSANSVITAVIRSLFVADIGLPILAGQVGGGGDLDAIPTTEKALYSSVIPTTKERYILYLSIFILVP